MPFFFNRPAAKSKPTRKLTTPRKPITQTMGIESLEQRMALSVSTPSIRLAAASDSGIKGDGITRVAQPVLTGVAAKGSLVSVWDNGGALTGVAKAGVSGAWSLKTPARKALRPGDQIVTATATNSATREVSGPGSLWIKLDTTKPLVESISYDVNNCVAVLTFSKPVVGVRLAGVFLVGYARELRQNISVSLSDPEVNKFIGRVTLNRSPDMKTYTMNHYPMRLAEPGSFRLTAVARGSGIRDFAGNPLAFNATTFFTID